MPRGKPAKPTEAAKRRALRERLHEWAVDHDCELIFFDPPEHFDDAILGVVYGYSQEPAIVYDEGLVLAAMQQDGMDAEAAAEWFEFNTIGAYLGPATPRFLVRREEIDDE